MSAIDWLWLAMTSPDSLRLQAWTSLETWTVDIVRAYWTVSVDFAEVKVIKSSLLYLPIYWVPFSKLKSIRLFSRSPFCFSGVEDDDSQISKYKLEIMKKWSGTCHVFRVDTNNGKNWKPLGETSGGIQVQVNQRGIKTLTDGVLINEVNLKKNFSNLTLIDLSDTTVIRFNSGMHKCKVCAIKCIRKWRSFRFWVQKRRWSTSFSK